MQPQSNKHIIFGAAAIVVILILSGYLSNTLKQMPKLDFVEAKTADITQGVNVDGTVQSAQDLSLAFEQGGTVTAVYVKEGDKVKQGQVLVKLDSADAAAAVSQASAALATAQANYEKLTNGATSADINVTQTSLANAKTNFDATQKQQAQLVQNALFALLNSGLTAQPSASNISTVSPIITGSYGGNAQGQYLIKAYSTGSGMRFAVTGLESSDGLVTTTGATPLGTKGLLIQFPSAQVSPSDSWAVNIPNLASVSYTSNLNAYNAALQTQNQTVSAAQSAVDSATAALTLKQTPARPEDVASAKAAMQSAAAQLQTAQGAYNKNALVAPIDGIVTAVDTKVGQTVAGSTFAPGPDAIKMISDQKLQIVAYLSETDIGKIKTGDKAQVNLDAYGSGVNFDASVINIDPGANMSQGIATYKTTLQFSQDDIRIKTGMSASVTVTDETHHGALVVPASAIFTDNNKTFVLADAGNSKITGVQIQTGVYGIDGYVEVLSGLNQGQKVAFFGTN